MTPNIEIGKIIPLWYLIYLYLVNIFSEPKKIIKLFIFSWLLLKICFWKKWYFKLIFWINKYFIIYYEIYN